MLNDECRMIKASTLNIEHSTLTRISDEGSSFGQTNLRQVQDHPPPRRGARDLPESEAQAAAGVS
jgi:hypothetical protein